MLHKPVEHSIALLRLHTQQGLCRGLQAQAACVGVVQEQQIERVVQALPAWNFQAEVNLGYVHVELQVLTEQRQPALVCCRQRSLRFSLGGVVLSGVTEREVPSGLAPVLDTHPAGLGRVGWSSLDSVGFKVESY